MNIPLSVSKFVRSVTMERTFSVDDLIGGMWRLNQAAQAGMGRTDSEAAFQEFLKRIPSATNLAAAAGQTLDQQQQAQFQQQVQQLQQHALQHAATQNASSTPPPSSSLPSSSLPQSAAAAAAAGGLSALHRVPSLDLIRQLVSVNNHGFSQALAQPAVKPDAPPQALSVSPADLASLSASGALTAALQAGSSMPGAGTNQLSGGLTPAAAAAALQLGQLGQLRFGAAAQQVDKETVEKAEIRRARR
jgi:hypothetical protein